MILLVDVSQNTIKRNILHPVLHSNHTFLDEYSTYYHTFLDESLLQSYTFLDESLLQSYELIYTIARFYRKDLEGTENMLYLCR